MVENESIDFGRLDESNQQAIIRTVSQSLTYSREFKDTQDWKS